MIEQQNGVDSRFGRKSGRFSFQQVLAISGLVVATLGQTTLARDPYVLVLGTAQDGGLPQIGCRGANCTAARMHPERRRLVASLLIADPRTGKRWLIDATPDLKEQVRRAEGHPATRKTSSKRPPLFEGIFLSHAHTGHYAGLIHLGRPAYNANRQPVFVSNQMKTFLTHNGPWDLMVKTGNLELHVVSGEEAVLLGNELSVTPFRVPHRAEYTDTFGFLIQGPKRKMLYSPDIDKWTRWNNRIEDRIAAVDVALLDGTFFAGGEVPGRDISKVPHPFIESSLRRFQHLPANQRAKIFFTHFNHTNPATDPGSSAAAKIRNAGLQIATEGQEIEL